MTDPLPYPRIALAIPFERNVYTEAVHSLFHIIQNGHLAAMFLHGYSRCDRSRNDFGIALLESNCTHVLMLDSDHQHPADIVVRLGRHVARDPSLLVVGGLNFRRGPPYDPCAYVWDDDHTLYPIVDWPENALLPVDVLGSGSILIAREVFEKMSFPWFGYDYTGAKARGWPNCDVADLKTAQWPGTDIWFSGQCEKLGIQQWVDTSCTSPHLMHILVDKETWAAQLTKWEALGEMVKKEAPPVRGLQMGDETCQDENDASSVLDGVPTPSASELLCAESLRGT